MEQSQRKNNIVKAKNSVIREFLLTHFDPSGGYEEKEVNGFWLIKQFNRLSNLWNVAVFTQKSFSKRKNHEREFRGKRYKVTRRNRR